jgi:hypothetical protein
MSASRDCLVCYYQAEVLGEAFCEALIGKFPDPGHAFKIGSLLQLETETKARLRPAMVQLGGSLEELEQSRQARRELADSMAGGDWKGFVSVLSSAGEPLLNRQREVAETAPSAYRELAESMRIHGESLQNFTEAELAGEQSHSIDEVVEQLKFPLQLPR